MKINIHTHKASTDIESGDIEIVNHIIGFDSPDLHIGKLCSCGIHPWYVFNPDEQLCVMKKLLVNNSDIVAIGEAGIDKLHTEVPLSVQTDIFTKQALLAEDFSKPLIIHCVKAWDEIIYLKKKISPSVVWLIHGFRGNSTQALQLVRNGFAISFGPRFNPEALKAIWNYNIFLETDDADVSINDVYRTAANSLEISPEILELEIAKKLPELHIFH